MNLGNKRNNSCRKTTLIIACKVLMTRTNVPMNNITHSFLTSLIIFVCSLMASTGTIVAPICCVIPPASPSWTWVWRIYKHKILIQLTLYQDSRRQLCFLRISWAPASPSSSTKSWVLLFTQNWSHFSSRYTCIWKLSLYQLPSGILHGNVNCTC